MKLISKLALFSIGLLVVEAGWATEATAEFTASQKAAIENVVHDYLLKNPQLLVEVSQKLQVEEQAKVEEKVEEVALDQSKALFGDKEAPVVGNPNGTVTLVEFFDYQCGHCKEMGETIAKLTKANPNLRVVLRDLPIFGENSRYAALASIAAYRLNAKAYDGFHQALLTADKQLTPEETDRIAQSQGFDLSKLTANMKSQSADPLIRANYKLADDLGISGTPAFIIANVSARGETSPATKVFFIPGATSQSELQSDITKVLQ